MSDDADELLERLRPAFEEGFLQGLSGRAGPLTVIDTKWGPVEGVVEGNTTRWELPNHEWIEVRLFDRGAAEVYRNDRLVGRVGPVEVEEELEVEEGD